MNTATSAVTVLGAGSYGTALAICLARNGHKVTLWGRNSQDVATLAAERKNQRYLPDIPFPDTLILEADLQRATQSSDIVLVVVPSHAFADTLKQIKPALRPNAKIAWATKGLEPNTGRLLQEVAVQELGEEVPLAVLSGPTFAKEMAMGSPTVKNVIAIGAGISDGVGFGANARTALITRGLAELSRLGCALGAKPETFMGMAGLGDLILTCTDNQSRNRRFGLALGEGKSVEQALKDIGQSVEGYRNTKEVVALASRNGVEMPIAEQIYAVLYEGKEPQQAAIDLLSRERKTE